VFLPFIYMSILGQFYQGTVLFFGGFVLYSYLAYIATYSKLKQKYPLVPPEGRPDIYFPRTNIPRPIYEDAQRARERARFFKKKKQRTRKKE